MLCYEGNCVSVLIKVLLVFFVLFCFGLVCGLGSLGSLRCDNRIGVCGLCFCGSRCDFFRLAQSWSGLCGVGSLGQQGKKN